MEKKDNGTLSNVGYVNYLINCMRCKGGHRVKQELRLGNEAEIDVAHRKTWIADKVTKSRGRSHAKRWVWTDLEIVEHEVG